MTTESDSKKIELMISKHPEIASEFERIQLELEADSQKNARAPHRSLQPLVLATFDYMARMESGEQPASPPVLNSNSKVEDFQQWLDRPDMISPAEFDDIYAKIISATPEMTCALVWINYLAPDEVHTDEYERFLILEGTCTIVVGSSEHQLVPGDYFAIPLYETHKVVVTSEIPCKVILQRIAA